MIHRMILVNIYFFRDPLFEAVDPVVLVLFRAFPTAFRRDGGSGEVDAADEAVDNLVDLRVGLADWSFSSSGPTLRVDRPFLAGRLL
jgi:hypothetical protein